MYLITLNFHTSRFVDVGDLALVTGWGRTTNDLKKSSNLALRNRVQSKILKKVRVPIVSVDICKTADKSFKNVDAKTQICAGGKKGESNQRSFN